ncbi:MAG: hypothetical protein R2747_03160 [Pyrinomonadaceae bacterium]
MKKEKKKDALEEGEERSFIIKSYWEDLVSYPNDLNLAPSFVVSSTTKRTDTPAAILYFHNFADSIGFPSYDSIRNIYYLHYHISAIEVVHQLLESGNCMYYWKSSGAKQWAGIRSIKETPIRTKTRSK